MIEVKEFIERDINCIYIEDADIDQQLKFTDVIVAEYGEAISILSSEGPDTYCWLEMEDYSYVNVFGETYETRGTAIEVMISMGGRVKVFRGADFKEFFK